MFKEFEILFDKIAVSINVKKVSKLKTLLRGAINNILNLSNLLVRKSLLKENLYNYTEKGDRGFFLPEEKAFLDNEKPRVMYDRIKALINALEYQASILPNDINLISAEYLENCNKLLSFLSFHNLNSSNAGLNTRTIRELTDKILTSKDQILRRIIQDNIKLLSDNFNQIQSIVDELFKYKKEKYKTTIRIKVFSLLPESFKESNLQENPVEYLKRLYKFMEANTPDVPFNKKWILEAIKACYSISDQAALEKIKNDFLGEAKIKEVATVINSPREKLLNIIEQIASTSNILEDLYIRIDQNLKFLENRKKNVLEQFMDIIKGTNDSLKKEKNFFHIEYINPTSKVIQNDTINIQEFLSSIKKKINLFNEIANTSSSVYEKIKLGTEEALYKYMETTYFELLLLKERIIGINGELRLRLARKTREKLKDIISPIEKFDASLIKISALRRKYVTEQDSTLNKAKPRETTANSNDNES